MRRWFIVVDRRVFFSSDAMTKIWKGEGVVVSPHPPVSFFSFYLHYISSNEQQKSAHGLRRANVEV